jgi:hypothetical protein
MSGRNATTILEVLLPNPSGPSFSCIRYPLYEEYLPYLRQLYQPAAIVAPAEEEEQSSSTRTTNPDQPATAVEA